MSHLLQELVNRVSGGFVLAFHEIPPEHLEMYVNSLRPLQPVHLSVLVDRSRQGRSTHGLFSITVDDGVGSNVRALASLFLARSWPATFYLPTGYLDTGQGMAFQWWRVVQPHLPRKRVVLRSGPLDLSEENGTRDLGRLLETLWHSHPSASYVPFTSELVEMVRRERGCSPDELATPPPISWPEVTELARHDEIRFESHGISHTAMSALTGEQLEFELRQSRDQVAKYTGRPCRHLAYPFGSWTSIGARAAHVASRYYDSAATMSLGSVDSANPWLLPRIPLYPSNSVLYARLKILCKCNPLSRPATHYRDGFDFPTMHSRPSA